MAEPRKLVHRNRRASFDFELLDRYEAGIVLRGTEVKSLREGKVSLQEAYARVRDGEVWLLNLDILPYRNAGHTNHEPKRPRKLLLHRSEIRRIKSKVVERGLTLVPTQLYFKDGLAKVEVAVAKGRPKGDKRARIRERDAKRDLRGRTLR